MVEVTAGIAALRSKTTVQYPSRLSIDLQPEVDRLINFFLSLNTQKNYEVAIKSFTNFCLLLDIPLVWPPNVQQITEYIAYMSLQQYAFQTINSHVSAISYVNKLNDLVDNTKKFVVKSMLEGIRKTKGRNNNLRQPVTVSMLQKLLSSLKSICRSQYECMLFSAAFSLAYIALLRISEFTSANKKSDDYLLSKSDIVMGDSKIRLYFKRSKTDQKTSGSFIDVTREDNNMFATIIFRHILAISLGLTKMVRFSPILTEVPWRHTSLTLFLKKL